MFFNFKKINISIDNYWKTIQKNTYYKYVVRIGEYLLINTILYYSFIEIYFNKYIYDNIFINKNFPNINQELSIIKYAKKKPDNIVNLTSVNKPNTLEIFSNQINKIDLENTELYIYFEKNINNKIYQGIVLTKKKDIDLDLFEIDIKKQCLSVEIMKDDKVNDITNLFNKYYRCCFNKKINSIDLIDDNGKKLLENNSKISIIDQETNILSYDYRSQIDLVDN